MQDIEERLTRIRTLMQHCADPIDDRRTIAQLRTMLSHMHRDGNRRDSPTREVLARLGDKWSPLLLLLLNMRAFRHATLWRLVGAVSGDGQISQRILRLRMRTLERDGLVQRQPVDTIPPGVMYELTETGRELAELIESIMVWTRKHIAHIRASQQRMDGLEKVANGGQADQSSQA